MYAVTTTTSTHNSEALEEVFPEHAPLSANGVSQVVPKQCGQGHSQYHQHEPGQALVDVVRVMALIKTLLPHHQQHMEARHRQDGGQLTFVLDGVSRGGA